MARLTNQQIWELAQHEIPCAVERLSGGDYDERAAAKRELYRFARAVLAAAAQQKTTTTTPPLSPAQKVRKAAVDAHWLFHPDQAAALLIAAADQVVPLELCLPEQAPMEGHIRQDQRSKIRRKLLAIANELRQEGRA